MPVSTFKTTDYHAKYFAHELTRKGGVDDGRLDRTLFDATVDLNPHQIEAAHFALRTPLSNGVLLADEVGLGKTIEAGLVICQSWAEKKRKILIITPASIRKQWEYELEEKFNLQATILDAKIYKKLKKSGIPAPFDSDEIVICSMHFAGRHGADLRQIPWDLVVIDEAHKLRNAHRPSNVIGRSIREATVERKKLLLTATPLQNSLLELYGLSTLIDDYHFGDQSSFRSQFMTAGGDLPGLRERLQRFCWRTLRRQVQEYVKYTNRIPITRHFNPTDDEQRLYSEVSAYLMSDDMYALPAGQRHLLIMLVRKVLASSPVALAGTLEIMKQRLLDLRDSVQGGEDTLDTFETEDEDIYSELLEDQEDSTVNAEADTESEEQLETEDEAGEQPIDLTKLNDEIHTLDTFIRLAGKIRVDTKTQTLAQALDVGFKKMEKLGANRKAVIFTESRRTQAFLKTYLEAQGYDGQVLTFNGTNTDKDSAQVYKNWVEKNKGSGKVTGSKTVDMRNAIIEKFRDDATILVATEAASEGFNLQFCSLIVNYDLPWNPQRIEQRIGRCHRYGQKYDVVVINFINQRNEADQRVFELLNEKFNLFSGVFGASDEVLGAIESGVDFEKRILEIYQRCRTPEQIDEAFNRLQQELDDRIQNKMTQIRQTLLDNFDEEVIERLRIQDEKLRGRLDRIGKYFWLTSRHILESYAIFHEKHYQFDLHDPPINIPEGTYRLVSKEQDNLDGIFRYRLSHPLGEYVLEKARDAECPATEVVFDITNHQSRIAAVEQMKGKSGWMHLQKLDIESFDKEEYLLFSAIDDSGSVLHAEDCKKLFNCGGYTGEHVESVGPEVEHLMQNAMQHVDATINHSLELNNQYFEQAVAQLDKWTDDMEQIAEKEIRDTKAKIKELRNEARKAPTMEERLKLEMEVQEQEKKKRRLRIGLDDKEQEISNQREVLIGRLAQRMKQTTTVRPLFTIRWKVI